MKKRTIIDAGALQVEIETPWLLRGDDPHERAAKLRATSLGQQRRNQILSQQTLELLLACNFPTAGSALVIVLTYDDRRRPQSRKEAQRRFKYFLKKLRDARRAAGLPEPRVVYAPEVLTSKSGHWHHHIVLDSTGRDLEIVRRCWIYGTDIQCDRLRVDGEKNHETLARYMSKELREAQEYECRPGLHGWGCTRNCRRPTVTVVGVDDSDQLRAPRGAEVLLHEVREWSCARVAVLKYRLGPRHFPKPPRARRPKP